MTTSLGALGAPFATLPRHRLTDACANACARFRLHSLAHGDGISYEQVLAVVQGVFKGGGFGEASQRADGHAHYGGTDAGTGSGSGSGSAASAAATGAGVSTPLRLVPLSNMPYEVCIPNNSAALRLDVKQAVLETLVTLLAREGHVRVWVGLQGVCAHVCRMSSPQRCHVQVEERPPCYSRCKITLRKLSAHQAYTDYPVLREAIVASGVEWAVKEGMFNQTKAIEVQLDVVANRLLWPVSQLQYKLFRLQVRTACVCVCVCVSLM